ncbi:MAG: DUF2892 domain-containing protein [Sphingobium sp.]
MKNVGNADRIIRLLIVVAVAIAYAMGAISGTVAIILGIIAAVLLLTGLFSFCPAYRLLGINTCRMP